MGLRINTNVASLDALRNLERVTRALGVSFSRLSSGLRIRSAADDPAGLAISERLRAQVRSLDRARRNTNDGISLVRTAESALDEVGTILTRLRELAVESANGTVSNSEKETLDTEFQSLVNEIDRIGRSTGFNGIRLLDGSTSAVSFQVGIGITSGIDSVAVSLDPALATTLNLDTLDIGSGGDISLAITQVDAAIDTVSSLRGRLGGVESRLASTVNALSVQGESLAAAESRIRDVDVAFETARLTRNSIIRQAGLAILAQANAMPRLVLSLLQ